MKKIIAAALSLLLLGGCSSKSPDLLPTEVLRVAVVKDSAECEEITALQTELSDKVASSLGIRKELVLCENGVDVLTALELGDADIGFPTLSVSDLVGSNYYVSEAYHSANLIAVYIGGATTDLGMLNETLIGAAKNIEGLHALLEYGEPVGYSLDDAVTALQNGSLSVFICIREDAERILNRVPDARAMTLEEAMTDYCVIMRRGRNILKEKIDDIIYWG